MCNWSKAWRLTPPERWLLAQALALLTLTAVALRLVSLRRWHTMLEWTAPAGSAWDGSEQKSRLEQALAVARMVDAAARRGPGSATCLPRSLALWWLLRRRRIDSEVRIGVRKEAGRFEAHAWVELGGVPLNDGTDVRERFSTFDRAILAVGGTC